MRMTSSATMMERDTWITSMDLENEVVAISIQSMAPIAKEGRPFNRGSQDSINPFSLEAHPGEATGNTYVRLITDKTPIGLIKIQV